MHKGRCQSSFLVLSVSLGTGEGVRLLDLEPLFPPARPKDVKKDEKAPRADVKPPATALPVLAMAWLTRFPPSVDPMALEICKRVSDIKLDGPPRG
jgi:hypothetical protein